MESCVVCECRIRFVCPHHPGDKFSSLVTDNDEDKDWLSFQHKLCLVVVAAGILPVLR